jgi:predicted transcriptional regulator
VEKAESVFHQSQVQAPRVLRIRRHFDLIAGILEAAIEKRRQTWIMYQCSLSYRQVKTYFKLLTNVGLLERSEERNNSGMVNFFKTTKKGLTFLKAYEQLLKILEED